LLLPFPNFNPFLLNESLFAGNNGISGGEQRASPEGDYEMVTTDLPQANPESCTVCPNGDYLQIAVLFLGGGIQAALLKRITVFFP
jgi:hypothetical protein